MTSGDVIGSNVAAPYECPYVEEGSGGKVFMMPPAETTMDELVARYKTLLFDAYGVLVHSTGALEGAGELIRTLNEIEKPYYILTNDASKLPETAADLFPHFGLDIEPEKIITSGTLLKDYFVKNRLEDSRCVVLGPEDSRRYVEMAGGRVVGFDEAFDVLVVGDESGFPFLETLDHLLGRVMGKLSRNEQLDMILPNPDLIYPKGDQGYGFASGSIALLFERAIRLRYPQGPSQRFVRLGKPHAAIFNEAFYKSGSRNMVMIGDQLGTDIYGANCFGIDSVLVSGGIMTPDLEFDPGPHRPDFLLSDLAISTTRH